MLPFQFSHLVFNPWAGRPKKIFNRGQKIGIFLDFRGHPQEHQKVPQNSFIRTQNDNRNSKPRGPGGQQPPIAPPPLRTPMVQFLFCRKVISNIECNDGTIHEADIFVMASGIESAPLGRKVGVNLPVYPMRGNIVTIPMKVS